MEDSNSEASTRAPPGTVAELIEFICAPLRILEDKCPTWPPDVFGIAATIMRRNGAYVRCVPTGPGRSLADASLLDAKWPRLAQRVGRAWREAVCAALKDKVGVGEGKLSFSDAIRLVAVPEEVCNAWKRLTTLAPQWAIDRSRDCDELSKAIIQLSGYADEASAGLGLPWIGPKDQFCAAASFFLGRNQKLSFCCAVDPQKARVLAKKHTPQQGLTLRSMSHHLSLCMPWEVEAQWFEVDAPRLNDVLNLLLLPWPLEVQATDFRCVKGSNSVVYEDHRCFEYKPPEIKNLKESLTEAIRIAKSCVSDLHAIILPELALTCEEWELAEGIALKNSVLLVAGIIDDKDDANGLPVNSCRIQLGSLSGRDADQSADAPLTNRPPEYRQTKHHRWCLDRDQVLQYDLGGQLPSAMRCWENSHVGRRGIFFATLGGWLTFSVLICEDLARQDPIAEVLRSVGPNLVVALLMDGPQLGARWPARYASVLADDPGSSVLTLTSLGMCKRSRPAHAPRSEPSTIIAMWKDKLYGSKEIALDKGSVGCVLSLSCKVLEEFTADGRSDHKATEVPVFSGIFQVNPSVKSVP
jgi:hypothetical protein